jgi:DNA recombination protein RmuC
MDIIILFLLIATIGLLIYIGFIKKNDNSGTIYEISNQINEKTKKDSRELREEITNTIQKSQETQNNIFNKASQVQTEQLINMTNMQNEKMNEMIQSNNEFQQKIVIALNNSLKDMQESNERKLDKIESTVNEKLDKTLNARLDSSFKQIGDQLSELYKSLGELNKLSTGVTDLNRTLSNVKTRGTWGEIQLQAILEQTMVRSQYDINIPTKKNSNDRIEFAIKIPTKDDSDEFIYLPIDSKMPTDIYNKIMTASENADPVLLSSATKELEQRIKTEARTIRDKYIDPPNTTDFAIMFLPTESLYAEVLRINGLMEWCQINCKIVISGPSTITALLNSLRLGFSNMALNKKSKDVLKLLQAIKTQYVTLSGLIDKTQKKLHDATVATEALKTRTDMIQKRMIKIEELELQDANEFLGLPEPEDD